jgi:3-hydroxy-5-methyl-1-naphthoate 3-O-methyltransferase
MVMMSGLRSSSLLVSAVELELFPLLERTGPMVVSEVAATLGLRERPAEVLVVACAALGLLQRDDGARYANSPLAQTYLIPGQPEYFGDVVSFIHDHQYAAWGRLTEALRRDTPTTWDAGGGRGSVFDPGDPTLAGLWRGLFPLSRAVGRALATAFDLTGYRALLDVGGGTGPCSVGLCETLPELTATVFDLPFVIEHTERAVATAGLGDRIGVHGGDFTTEALPGGHDLVLLSNVLHDWDQATGAALLAACLAALPSGGGIIVTELMLDDDKSGSAPAALMGLTMLVETSGGRSYTAAEHGASLQAAGFTDVRVGPLPTVMANRALLARKP